LQNGIITAQQMNQPNETPSPHQLSIQGSSVPYQEQERTKNVSGPANYNGETIIVDGPDMQLT
jgi:hypothetical protein